MKGIVRFVSVTLAASAVILNFSWPANAACVQHEFYQKYLAVAKVTTSKHTVGTGENSVICTITTTTHNVVDVCKHCGYHGSSYLVSKDVHSAGCK